MLLTVGIWWFWGGDGQDLNIIDLLYLIAGYLGGKIGSGG